MINRFVKQCQSISVCVGAGVIVGQDQGVKDGKVLETEESTETKHHQE